MIASAVPRRSFETRARSILPFVPGVTAGDWRPSACEATLLLDPEINIYNNETSIQAQPFNVF